ncbi:MAG TPA: hypothetical protein VEG64_17610 [Candidatus Sulfotelmatobacter sp.]|nr:hypothetical protein [Candidatus Sulfotelmatobacter sp.]
MTGRCYYLTTLGDWKKYAARCSTSHWVSLAGAGADAAPDDSAQVLCLVEADEGVHLALEDDKSWEALPHPLAQKPISPAVQAALAPLGVAPGATTFDAAESAARVHPLLRHRVF